MPSYAAKLKMAIETTGSESAVNKLDDVTGASTRATKAKEGLAGAGGKLTRAFSTIAGPAKAAAKGVAIVAGAATAASAAIVALTKSAADSARELSMMSQVANTTNEQFQSLAFAANTVGIQSDKLSDIYKDMADRVGDFISTGAGPLADFFENIAPKVGVTAENFRKLSGPDALQLYVSSLERANISQSEMVFYMEAIASDSTALLPLLQNNGKQMGIMADRARDLGIVLSDIEVEQLKSAGNTFGEVGAIISNVRDQIAIQLAPLIGEIAKRFTDSAVDAGGFGKVVANTMESSARSIGTLMDAMAFMSRMWDGIKVAVIGVEMVFIKSMQGWSMISDMTFSGIAKAIQWLASKFDAFANYINNLGPRMFSAIGSGADAVFNYVADKINWMLDAMDSIPWVEVNSRIDAASTKFQDALTFEAPTIIPTIDMGAVEYGASKLTKNLGVMFDVAKDQAADLMAGITESANNPPSDAIIQWFSDIKTAAETTALATITAQGAANVATIDGAKETATKLAEVRDLVSLQNSKAWNKSRAERDAKEKAADARAAADSLATAQMVASQKQGIMANMTSVFQSLMQSSSKKEFELGKRASIGMAIINTYQGATKALAQGGIFGPILAGTIVAAGMAQVRQIQSTQFGGSAATAAPAPALPSTPTETAAPRQSNVTISIGDSQFFSRDTVMQLIEGLNDAVADGAQLRVV